MQHWQICHELTMRPQMLPRVLEIGEVGRAGMEAASGLLNADIV